MFITHKVLLPFGVATLLATGGAAFLAQNTQPVSGQGVSVESIDGYSISGIHYSVDPPPNDPAIGVVSVTFEATTTTQGELAAAQGFINLDPSGPPPPPGPGPGDSWTNCGSPTSASNPSWSPSWAQTVSFTCNLNPEMSVNGPGNQIGVLDNLGIEVNQ